MVATTDFNYDFEVSIPHDVEHAGLSAFALEDGLVYHTYSCYSRGLEAFNSAYQLLDRAPRAATRTSCRCRSPGFGATTSTKTGYPRFAAQGGDWGGYVVGRLVHAHWDKLLGVHLNFLPVPLDMPFPAELTEEDRAYLEEIRHWQDGGDGLQSHPRHETADAGVCPDGFADGTRGLDCREVLRVERPRRRPRASDRHRVAPHEHHALQGHRGDQLVVLAVLRGPARAVARSSHALPHTHRLRVLPREIRHPPRSFAEQVFNIQRWTEMPRGGHFAALEAPELPRT